MRLPIADYLNPVQKMFLLLWRRFFRGEPGYTLVVSYRKTYFGNPWTSCIREGLRKTRHWKKEEVELLGAFISKVNSCDF